MSEPFQIPIGKHDWVNAVHDPAQKSGAGGSKSDILVIFAHGFPGDMHNFGDIFAHLSATINKAGHDTLRFDFRGCGGSRKRSEFFTLHSANEDLQNVLKWARDHMKFKRVVIVADGLAAATTLSALTDSWRAITCGVVLLWPILDPKNSWLNDLVPLLAKAETAGHDHVAVENAALGLPFLREIRDFTLNPLAARLSMPTQIHYGEADQRAPIGQIDLIRTGVRLNTSPTRLDITGYTDGDHGLKTPHARKLMTIGILGFLKSLR